MKVRNRHNTRISINKVSVEIIFVIFDVFLSSIWYTVEEMFILSVSIPRNKVYLTNVTLFAHFSSLNKSRAIFVRIFLDDIELDQNF